MPRKPSTLARRSQYSTAGRVAVAATRAMAKYATKKLVGAAAKRWSKKGSSRPRMFLRVKPVGTGSSQSWYKGGRKARLPGKLLKTLQPARVMNQATSGRLEGAIGQQAVMSERFLTVGQIQDMFAQLTTGGSNTQRLYLKKVTGDFLITNATSSNTFVRIYELTARRDFNVTTASSGALTNAIWQPEGAFDQGMFDVSASTSNAATALGSTPFQSGLFTKLWRVNKVYNIELGSGRSHKHSTTYDVNTFVDEIITGKDSGSRRNQILKGISRAIMIIAYGAPVNSDATDTNVSTAKPALNIVRMDRHYIHTIDPQGQQYYRVSTIPGFSDPQEVDEEGNVQTPTEA